MQELTQRIVDFQERVNKVVKSLNLERKEVEIKRLEGRTLEPGFWDDQESAKLVMQELGHLKEQIRQVKELKESFDIIKALDKAGELEPEMEKDLLRLEQRLSEFELETFLSSAYDKRPAIISIHAGQGGTEAMDWTSMLLRMYMRYCESKGWEWNVIEESSGEEAGLKNVTFKVNAPYAYGYLKRESGTHRLVRQSPFNADKLRQTSFALVEVMPQIDEVDAPDIQIKDDDLEWQFFRASTQGGQNVQKVSTAVRLTHKPTGIVVTSQRERFQAQNRKIALDLLRSKLWLRAQEEVREKKQEIRGEYKPASWGTQIRSYVLHPYKLVKDLRTGVEKQEAEAVLDGDLDDFIDAQVRSL